MEKSFSSADPFLTQGLPKLPEKKLDKERKSFKSKKILKSKKYAHHYFEKKTKNIEENNSLLNFSLDSRMEKKRVYTKRTTEKIRRWTKEEADQYEKFIDMYSDIFNESGSKRVTKVFIQMSQFIGTKTPSQCRSHHQKFFKRLQRARLLAAGHIINEDDFKKKRKNNTKKQKVKKDALLLETQVKIEEKINIDESVNTTKGSFVEKIEPLAEKCEDNKLISTSNPISNCSTSIPIETNEIIPNPNYIINNNYYYNNNYYCENQYVYNNYNGFPPPPGPPPSHYLNDTKVYLRKPSCSLNFLIIFILIYSNFRL